MSDSKLFEFCWNKYVAPCVRLFAPCRLFNGEEALVRLFITSPLFWGFRGEKKKITAGSECKSFSEKRGEPWGRKQCGLKAGGRFAPSCRLTPPRNAGRDILPGAPKLEVGHLMGGQNLLKIDQKPRK